MGVASLHVNVAAAASGNMSGSQILLSCRSSVEMVVSTRCTTSSTPAVGILDPKVLKMVISPANPILFFWIVRVFKDFNCERPSIPQATSPKPDGSPPRLTELILRC